MQVLSAIWDCLFLFAQFIRWYQGLSKDAQAQFISESHAVFDGVKTAKTETERYESAEKIRNLIFRS